jgi:hypothetical protein
MRSPNGASLRPALQILEHQNQAHDKKCIFLLDTSNTLSIPNPYSIWLRDLKVSKMILPAAHLSFEESHAPIRAVARNCVMDGLQNVLP